MYSVGEGLVLRRAGSVAPTAPVHRIQHSRTYRHCTHYTVELPRALAPYRRCDQLGFMAAALASPTLPPPR